MDGQRIWPTWVSDSKMQVENSTITQMRLPGRKQVVVNLVAHRCTRSGQRGRTPRSLAK